MTDAVFQQPGPAVQDETPGSGPAPGPVELDPTLAAWLEVIRTADAEIARLTGIRGRAIEHLQTAMGDATEARVNGRPVVSWKPSKPASYIDRKALEAAHPDIAAQFTKLKAAPRPFKVLSIDG